MSAKAVAVMVVVATSVSVCGPAPCLPGRDLLLESDQALDWPVDDYPAMVVTGRDRATGDEVRTEVPLYRNVDGTWRLPDCRGCSRYVPMPPGDPECEEGRVVEVDFELPGLDAASVDLRWGVHPADVPQTVCLLGECLDLYRESGF